MGDSYTSVNRPVRAVRARVSTVLLAGVTLSGCVVPQRPGGGREFHLREPRMNAGYWLYLPEEYVAQIDVGAEFAKRYPLVMTFHGMKPFDSAHPQCREWQQEADRYGFAVCAPELQTPHVVAPLPLKNVTSLLRRDEEAILAIMDELTRTVNVDPNAVLATSWSYGGYVAHYMVNRHPDRFTCLAVKQSNFAAELLDPRNVPRYRDHKIAVFYTENDFAICQRESQEAAVWYSSHGFDLTFAEFGDKGHERTPSLAAAFFARDCGARAKTPPVELASLRVKELPVLDRTDGRVAGLDFLNAAQTPMRDEGISPTVADAAAGESPLDGSRTGLDAGAESLARLTEPARPTTVPRRDFSQWRPMKGPSPLRVRPLTPHAEAGNRSERPPGRQERPEADNPVRVRLSSTIGIAPLAVSYSVALPKEVRREAYFLWTDNGEPISNGTNGQLFLTGPGEHRIEVLVTTDDGREYRAGRTVTVLRRVRPRGKP